jgi:hypothetical protein
VGTVTSVPLGPQVPRSRLPDDEATRNLLTEQIEVWWSSLDPAQKMTIVVRASGADPRWPHCNLPHDGIAVCPGCGHNPMMGAGL